jgi:hypothetical protein
MRYRRGDKVNCAVKCGGEVLIVNNIIPEQEGEIIHCSPAMVATARSQVFLKGGLMGKAIDKRIR